MISIEGYVIEGSELPRAWAMRKSWVTLHLGRSKTTSSLVPLPNDLRWNSAYRKCSLHRVLEMAYEVARQLAARWTSSSFT